MKLFIINHLSHTYSIKYCNFDIANGTPKWNLFNFLLCHKRKTKPERIAGSFESIDQGRPRVFVNKVELLHNLFLIISL